MVLCHREEGQVLEGISRVDHFTHKYPGDLVFIYREEPEEQEDGEGVKEEVSRAYDRVASTAQIPGIHKWPHMSISPLFQGMLLLLARL